MDWMLIFFGIALCIGGSIYFHRATRRFDEANELFAEAKDSSEEAMKIRNEAQSLFLDVARGSILAPETHKIKVTVPTFGKPVLQVYHVADYNPQLICTECKILMQEGDDFYEIPIPNAEPDNFIAVHLACERQNVYGGKKP